MPQTLRIMYVTVLIVIASHNLCVAQQEKTAEDLFQAARDGSVQSIESALNAGIDVNSKTRYGATALSYAAEKGHFDAVKLLVEKGADVNAKDSFYGWPAWTWANLSGHRDIAKFLVENGAEIPTLKRRPSASNKKDAKKSAEPDSEEEKIEYGPSSPESRLADRAVSNVNWPQFRGTGSRGVADGQNPPIDWNVEKEKNLAWRASIKGLGHSCPTIWGNRVYITSAISGNSEHSIKTGNYGAYDFVEDESEHRFVVYCLNKRDGQIIWEREAVRGVPKIKRHLKSTHANSTIATDGDHVIALFGSEGLYCYNSQGELLWKKDLGTLDSGWFYDKSYQWGFASSPVIYEDMVIVQCDIQDDSFIAAYHLNDGEEIWRTPREEIPGWSSPNVVETPDGPMVLTHATQFAKGYDARTGKEIWRLGEHSEVVVPTPFVAHDLIYLTSGYSPIQPIYAVSINAKGDITLSEGEESNEHIPWCHKRGGPYMPSPIVYGDYLYTCQNHGILTCIHATTGEQVYRSRLTTGLADLELTPKDIGGTVSMVASPVAGDGHLYFAAEQGVVFVVKAGPKYELVAVNQIGESILSTPAISEGMFFVRGQNHLFAFKTQ